MSMYRFQISVAAAENVKAEKLFVTLPGDLQEQSCKPSFAFEFEFETVIVKIINIEYN